LGHQLSMPTPKILAFAGSTRTASYNKHLVKIAAEGVRAANVAVEVIDLRDFPLPLYDGDLEEKEGMPANAKKLKALMLDASGFLISAPEYNSSITAVLKNTIDWASRAESEDEKPLACFRGKAAALLSASPGGFGGMRGLVHLRSILGNIGMHVLPDQISIATAHEAFDGAGQLKHEGKRDQVLALGKSLAEFVVKYQG
jgi:chromate reductase, NAD(P)H dehydrogenase (quinone)